jgi:NTE family protein
MQKLSHDYDQVLYVLQGGGALGAYQVGVCKGLCENNCHPDWVIGTSIGGINGAILAGNKPEDRIKKLEEFWHIITMPFTTGIPKTASTSLQALQNLMVSECAVLYGVPGFFNPRFPPPAPLQTEAINQLSYYDTTPLRKTLEKIIDFNYLNERHVRLTVCALQVETGELERFDSFKQEITPDHLLATGALPPGFPAVTIDGKNYWDGGINSNTPLEFILQENTSDKILCFILHLFAYVSETPKNMLDVLKRRKDLEFASRYKSVVDYFCELQHMRYALQEISKSVADPCQIPILHEICKHIYPSSLNVVRFHYSDSIYDLWTKDFEFSANSINERATQGYFTAQNAFNDTSWLNIEPNSIHLHNF